MPSLSTPYWHLTIPPYPPTPHRRVIPELRAHLVEGEAARAPVALAIVKTLRLLPQAAVRAELPRALQGVANLLKARLQRIR